MADERDEYLAVLKALYDYDSTSEDEVTIKEDQILFLIERTDDEWWKVKHKPESIDDEMTPTGLVPASYVEEAQPNSIVKALYDYEAAALGELSVTEGEILMVYEKEEDWLLVKAERDSGKVGYVPGNYVEESSRNSESAEMTASSIVIPDSPPQRHASTYVDPADRVIAATDRPKADDIQTWAVSEVDKKGKKKKGTLGVGNGAIFFASESDKTPVRKWQTSLIGDIKIEKSKHLYLDIGGPTPENLHFNVGNKDVAEEITKKLQSSKTLVASTSLSQSNNSPSPPSIPISSGLPQHSSADSQPVHKPNKNGASVHFAQSPAVIPDMPVEGDEDEDELQGDNETGSALYDFAADGEDELSVKEGEQLIILDRTSSDEWWKCRNMQGDEGVVPASYIEVTTQEAVSTREEGSDENEEDNAAAEAEQLAAQAREEDERRRRKLEADREAKLAAAAAKAGQERREQERKERERKEQEREEQERKDQERKEQERRERERKERERKGKERKVREREERVARESEASESNHTSDAKRSKNSSRPKSSDGNGRHASNSRDTVEAPPKFPNAGKTRIWHDHSGQWRTEAEFLGINKGKIRLHKINGVVIEVPPEKMSPDDLRHIESITGHKFGVLQASRSRSKDDDDMPLAKLSSKSSRSTPKKVPTVDWFDFFLNAGCEVDDCTRYASSFERDKIDEAILPDIKDSTLRSLGLREGDIIRVMKAIEQRKAEATGHDDMLKTQIMRDEEIAKALQAEEDSASLNRRPNTAPAPNLFSGPGGALKPRRGRPQPKGSAPPVNVDVNSITSASDQIARTGSPRVGSPSANPASPKRTSSAQPSGFDDDAWTNRPSSTKPAPPATTAVSSPAPPALSQPPVNSRPASSPPTSVQQQPASLTSSTSPAAVVPQGPPPPPTVTTSSPPSQDSGQFEILAKIGQMRPSPAPPPQTSVQVLGPPATVSPPPQSFVSGLGMGSSQLSIGEHVQNQQSGMYAQQALSGPRGPLAPVPQNQGLLNPLIPTTTGFNQFVPTRPASNPTFPSSLQQPFQTQVQPPFLSSPPTAFGQPGPLMPQQTGFPAMISQPTGIQPAIYSGVAPQPTGFGGSSFGEPGFPSFMPPTVMGHGQPGATGPNNFSQPSLNSSLGITSPPKDHSPANVFAQMKSGTFAQDSDPQPAEKYDSLRPQQTGMVFQQSAFQVQGPYGGL